MPVTPSSSQSLFRAAVTSLLIVQLCAPMGVLAQQSGVPQQAKAPAAQPVDDSMQDSPDGRMAAQQEPRPASGARLPQDEILLQTLNRFTYGPRPGDIEKLRAEGLNAWLKQQLNPSTIDDSALDGRLADYPAMKLGIRQLMTDYPNNAMVRAAYNGQAGAHGEGEKAIYAAAMAREKQKLDAGKLAAKTGETKQQTMTDMRDEDAAPLPATPAQILAMAPKDRFNLISKLSPPQVKELEQALDADQKALLTDGLTPHELEVLAALRSPTGVVASELIQTKLLRDVYSERQMNEIMVDFWLNHFNTYVKKSQYAPYYEVSYERDTIRPHAMGNFEDLLVATATSPAMLSYLDNYLSVGPHSESVSGFAQFRRGQNTKKAASGLNENYARELMELHTLGVDGGYTQQDVTEVAKVFTGWTLARDGQGYGPIKPEFDPSKHEPGDKMVLGVKIKGGGMEEGMKVLHLLATSPKTAHFISTKLAIRFVSDDPPPAMVSRMAGVFLESHGDVRRVLLAMIQSPEFYTRDSYKSKVKTPLDYVISAVRASGSTVDSAAALQAAIAELGMPLYGHQTPDGYSMLATQWNNTSALVSRMNFALALSSNRVAGLHTDLPALMENRESQPGSPAALAMIEQLSPEAKDKMLEEDLLHGLASDRTRATILAQITQDPGAREASLHQISSRSGKDVFAFQRKPKADGEVNDTQIALAAGLILGSPEFQRR